MPQGKGFNVKENWSNLQSLRWGRWASPAPGSINIMQRSRWNSVLIFSITRKQSRIHCHENLKFRYSPFHPLSLLPGLQFWTDWSKVAALYYPRTLDGRGKCQNSIHSWLGRLTWWPGNCRKKL